MAWSKMVDLELDDEDRIDTFLPIAMPDKPQYPCGVRICLTHVEIAKLGLDIGDCDVGDIVDIRIFGEITSKSIDQGENGDRCRVEIQGQRMAIENETTEEAPESAAGEAREAPTPERREAPSYGNRGRGGMRRLRYGKDYAKQVE